MIGFTNLLKIINNNQGLQTEILLSHFPRQSMPIDTN